MYDVIPDRSECRGGWRDRIRLRHIPIEFKLEISFKIRFMITATCSPPQVQCFCTICVCVFAELGNDNNTFLSFTRPAGNRKQTSGNCYFTRAKVQLSLACVRAFRQSIPPASANDDGEHMKLGIYAVPRSARDLKLEPHPARGVR